MEQGQIVIAINITLAIFTLGLSFYCGQLVQRVKVLEDWRSEFKAEIIKWKDEVRLDFTSVREDVRKEAETIRDLIQVN